MRINIIFILLLLGSLFSTSNSDIPDIVIIGSANVHGEIEPCG